MKNEFEKWQEDTIVVRACVGNLFRINRNQKIEENPNEKREADSTDKRRKPNRKKKRKEKEKEGKKWITPTDALLGGQKCVKQKPTKHPKGIHVYIYAYLIKHTFF